MRINWDECDEKAKAGIALHDYASGG